LSRKNIPRSFVSSSTMSPAATTSGGKRTGPSPAWNEGALE